MAGFLEQIEQDMTALHKAAAELAQELHHAYNDYLNVLAPAARQQLILASYHICTQGYPEQFLGLSYGQRLQLQQTLRKLADQTQEELLAQLHPPTVPVESTISPLAEPEPLPTPHPLTPFHLAQWQQDLEDAIAQELQTASHAANRLLQQANILPQKLPEPILEVASKADTVTLGNTPNLMNLIVEAPGGKDDENSDTDDFREQTVIHIMAIHLRLPEIEFADAAVTVARQQVRSLQAQLRILKREYKKKQQERAIAEAQAAWRVSWPEA